MEEPKTSNGISPQQQDPQVLMVPLKLQSSCLKKFDRTLTKPRKLSLTQFKTICYEAAQLTNDRPLHPFTDQEDHLTYVTPNKLVFGKQSQPVPLKVTEKT